MDPAYDVIKIPQSKNTNVNPENVKTNFNSVVGNRISGRSWDLNKEFLKERHFFSYSASSASSLILIYLSL